MHFCRVFTSLILSLLPVTSDASHLPSAPTPPPANYRTNPIKRRWPPHAVACTPRALLPTCTHCRTSGSQDIAESARSLRKVMPAADLTPRPRIPTQTASGPTTVAGPNSGKLVSERWRSLPVFRNNNSNPLNQYQKIM